jgi:SAM-dependent methyltransferase
VTWDGATADWWRSEVESDPAYARDVDPLLVSTLGSLSDGPVLDLGCGDGRLLTRFGATGVDASLDLAREADRGTVVVADVGRLPFATGQWQAAYAVLVLEHLTDPAPFFAEAARVVTSGGVLGVVVNHPIYTAPGSGPFLDPDDGEVLWRWGGYLERGATKEPAGSDVVVFHHRPLGVLLTAAAGAGWRLATMLEKALQPAGDPLLEAQQDVPRLLGIRWSI